jgi:hypothetical protein
MDIAFPALVIFLFAAPGFIFREFNQRREIRATESTPFGRTSLVALLYSAIINSIAYGTARLNGYEVRLGDIYLLLVQPENMSTQQQHWQVAWNTNPSLVLNYFGLTWFGAWLAATIWLLIVTHYDFERPGHKLSAFVRGDAPWFYLLTGADHTSPVDGTFVAATVGIEGQAYLYQGLLAGFELADDGRLDRLVLTQAARRLLNQDRTSVSATAADRFYAISGDQFVLKYSEISTLNISYLLLADQQHGNT